MDFRVLRFCVFEFVTLFLFTNALSPDRLALLAFKASITNDTNSITSNWIVTDSTPCSWNGVTCTASGLVTGLNLSSQDIFGIISPSLGTLQSLQILDISKNTFEGPIPPELGNCSSLLELNLGFNLLNGTIPKNLGSLYSLTQMDISANALGGEIPQELGNLGNLTYLNVETNFLAGTIPESFGKLLQMEEIIFYGNNLGGSIPEAFFALPKLQFVDLTWNLFTGVIPPAIFNNTNLIDLRINNNYLTGDISSGLQSLTMNPFISYFDCAANELSGTIPNSLGNMTSLNLFFIYDNTFTGPIPSSIGNLKSLAWLGIFDNQLSGPIPPEIGKLKNLVYFLGYNNMFSGPIPSELGDCTMLQSLSLNRNPFIEGVFPPNLLKLVNLQAIDLSFTNMAGKIPLEVYNMTTLQVFALNSNNMTGSIPPEIGNLQNLIYLNIGTNFFSGMFPHEIENCTGMTELDITTNNFHGVLPNNYWNLEHLVFTAASLNQWTPGPFPTALAKFVNVTTISFYGVSFIGSLPPSLGMNSSLNWFGVHGASLNGTIPDGLCHGNELTYLDLSSNQFEGAIPTSLIQCTTLSTFMINNNRFTTLPIGFITNLTSMAYFDISFNSFGGPLSMDIGALPNLLTLNLNSNRFSGNLSSLDFGQISSVVSLNLSTNNFIGSIPSSIVGCKNLIDLDLSSNYLSGNITILSKLTKLQKLYLQNNKFSGFDAAMFTQLTNLSNLHLASNEWNTSIPSEIGDIVVLQSLNMSYGHFLGSIPSTLEALRDLGILDLSHNELEGTIPIELNNLVSLSSVNVSFNNLTGSLPPNWVMFIKMDLNDFVGNPWLCQNYSLNSLQCLDMTMTIPSKNNDKPLSNQMIVVIVICTILTFMMIVGLFGWWFFLLRMKSQQLGKTPIFFTTMVGKEIKFFDVMEATENMSNRCLLKKTVHGAVYKGILKSERPIILKTIEIVDDDAQSIQSYLMEIESLQNVKHHNIVKLLGFSKWGNIGLHLYDYIPNGDLDNALHGTETSMMLDWPTRLHIAKGVAHGMTYLHHDCSTPIIHRDIKASNVLLDKQLEPLLTDFGIAKVMATKTKDGNIESTNLVAGTYGYMAPEYVSGVKVSLKVDVYSYGVLLLELLTGKRPVDKTFGNLLHIVVFVRAMLDHDSSSIGDIIDPIIFIGALPTEQSQMLEVLNVALLCTNVNPIERPSAKEIEDMLHRSISSGNYC